MALPEASGNLRLGCPACQDGVPIARTWVMNVASDPAREAATSQSLERGLAILSTFTATKPLMGVSEVAREVGLSRSSAHRYIATLTKLGYLEQDRPSRRYRLGPRVFDLGFSAINSMEIRQIAAPDLQALSDSTGHTVNMAFL